MTPNGDFIEEKIYSEKFYIDNKDGGYQDRYLQNVEYSNGLPDVKYLVEGKEMVLPEKYAYQNYEEVQNYSEANGYVERSDKKVLKIKMK